MTRQRVNISSEKLATEVLAVLEKHPVDELDFINEKGEPVGLVDT